jgi:hypothetical protein
MMDTCAACRFWERDPSNADAALNECNRFRLPNARFDAGGIFLTRSDFGCVQFEAKPIPTHVHEFLPPSKVNAQLSAEVEMWKAERREAFIAGMRTTQPGFGSGTPISDEEEAAFQRYATSRQPRILQTTSVGADITLTGIPVGHESVTTRNLRKPDSSF